MHSANLWASSSSNSNQKTANDLVYRITGNSNLQLGGKPKQVAKTIDSTAGSNPTLKKVHSNFGYDKHVLLSKLNQGDKISFFDLPGNTALSN